MAKTQSICTRIVLADGKTGKFEIVSEQLGCLVVQAWTVGIVGGSQ